MFDIYFNHSLITWLEKNELIFPYEELDENMEVDSLFISSSSLDQPVYFEHDSDDKARLISSTINQLRDLYYQFYPKDFFYFSIDGTAPVARYQTLRYNAFKRANKEQLVRGFEYPDERSFRSNAPKRESRLFDNAIEELMEQLKNDDENETLLFIYSNDFVPGESEQKYFKYFRGLKRSHHLNPGQNHFIYSDNLETILYSLSFTDENFFIIFPSKSKGQTKLSVIDIAKVRHYFMQRMASSRPIDNIRLMNDIIGMMLMVDNKFIGKLKFFNAHNFTYDDLFDTYCKINDNNRKPYKFLIENDVFNVNVLKDMSYTLSKEIATIEEEKERKRREEERKMEEERKRREEERRKEEERKRGEAPPPPRTQSVQPSFPQAPPPRIQPVQPSFSQAPPPQTNTFFPAQPPVRYNAHVINNNNNAFFSEQRHQPTIERRKTARIEIRGSLAEQSQELLNLFNFAFIYYTQGPPSLNYYYPFKELPYLAGAIKNMKQENRSFFDDLDDEVPERLLQLAIVLPVYTLKGPWAIYKLKMPDSPIGERFWGTVRNIREIPIFHLQEVKDAYRDALEEMPDAEIYKYNRIDKDLILVKDQPA